jgi:hypothetical protein
MIMPSVSDAHEGRRAAEVEQAFWDEHYRDFVARYAEQFVAAKDGEVVAVARDLTQLILMLSAKNIDVRDTWVRYITDNPKKLLL